MCEGYSYSALKFKIDGMLTNTVVTPRCIAVCGSNEDWRRYLRQAREAPMVLGAGRPCLYSFGGRIASFAGLCNISRPRSLRVQAGWLFKGHDRGSESDASCEHSESVNEDILMFFFELDLATRVQVLHANSGDKFRMINKRIVLAHHCVYVAVCFEFGTV